MKLLSFYKWVAGSMTDFINQFKSNDALYNQARAYWDKLESSTTIILIIFLVLSISIAVFYYLPFNNRPGRHYNPKYWLIFLAVTFMSTFLITFIFEYLAVPPILMGAAIILLKIAMGNAIYASLLYLVVSIIWCNALPTNAYRLFKF